MGHGSDVPSRREWEAAADTAGTAGMRATTACRRRATRARCRRPANRSATNPAQLAAGRATCARRLRCVSAPRPTTVPRDVGTAARRAALQAQLAGAVTTDSSRCLTAGAAASRGARVAF